MPKRRPLAALALLALLAGPAAADGTPALVKQAAGVFARDAAGVVAYLGEADTALDAPLMKHRSRARMWIANQDGRPTRARVLTLLKDGKPAPEADRAKLEAETNKAYARGERGFDAPYDARHLNTYTIAPTACDGCAPGVQAFAFKSALRDERHGDGTFALDPSLHVRWVRYSPATLPKGASTAEVTIDRGPAPGVGWSLLRVRARYAGGVGPVAGSFTMDQRVSGHRRFASVDAAMAAAPR